MKLAKVGRVKGLPVDLIISNNPFFEKKKKKKNQSTIAVVIFIHCPL
jgi:tRNA1(Val) A37 N6-methylase TrmN6